MRNELKLLKENSRLKLCIILLIEEMSGIKEYRDVKKYLEDILIDSEERNKKTFLERWEKKENEDSR